MAISGTISIVGSSLDNEKSPASGAAYLFDSVTGAQLAKLSPSDSHPQQRFGESVAIAGTTAIVGAIFDDENYVASGAAYLFDTVTGRQIVKLLPTDGARQAEFGQSVSIDASTAVVGAWLDNDNHESGSAYTFTMPVLCRADLDMNGTVDNVDLDAFVNAFLAGDPLADLTGDGTINLDDIEAFIAAFLAGCP